MNVRARILASLLVASYPSVVHADEPIVITRPMDILDATSGALQARARALAPAESIAPLQEIRLSHGAKTAIIVTAIVVGVLIIAGVIAIGLPHHH